MKKCFSAFWLFLLPLCSWTQIFPPAFGGASSPGKIFLVVENCCLPPVELPMEAFKSALSAELASRGFVIARKDAADGILVASILDFSESYAGKPPLAQSVEFSMSVAMNLEDIAAGVAVCGETVEVPQTKYTEAQASSNWRECTTGLLRTAARTCAERLARNPAAVAWTPERAPAPLPPVELGIANLESSLENLLSRMFENPRFEATRDALKQRKGRLPIAVLGGLEDKCNAEDSSGERASLLEAGGQFVRIRLLDSGLFDVKDDEAAIVLSRRIVAGADSLIEDGVLVEHLKQHGSPDFFVLGDLRHLSDGASGIFRIRLAVHDLATGKVVWEGTDDIGQRKTAIP